MLTADEIVTTVRPKLKNSLTPLRSTESSATKSTRKVFHRTGFVLTSSPGNSCEAEKGRLQALIQTNGGLVFEDWCHVFNMDGTVGNNNKRWVLEKKEVRLLRPEVDKVFLLSDDACHKPKFLLALALGIPCLKHNWLDDSVEAVSTCPFDVEYTE